MKRILVVAAVVGLFGGFAVPAHALPAAPATLTVTSKQVPNTALNAAAVDVSWAKDAAVTAYQVVAVAAGQTTQFGSAPSCSDTTCNSVVSSLSGGVQYEFTVTAIDANGGTAASKQTAVPASIPGKPSVVTATATASGQVTLSWLPPSNTGGLPLTAYTITDGAAVSKSAAGDATSLAISNLTAGSPYVFKISATNALGSSAADTFSSVIAYGPASAPFAPVATVSDSSVSVSWSAPASNGAAITGYKVFLINGSGADVGTPITALSTATSASFSSLAVGTYTVKVLAANAAGDGSRSAASNTVTVATPSAPAAPVAQVSGSTVSASWSAPAAGSGSITGYTAYLLDANGADVASQIVTNPLSVSFTSLAVGTYTVKVLATSAVGSSARSSGSNAVVVAAPSPLSSPSANATGTSITVSWAAPASGSSPITGYKVYLINNNGQDVGSPVQVAAGTLTATISSVSPGTYTVQVVATNSVGDSTRSPGSSPVIVNSPVVSPPAPAPSSSPSATPTPSVTPTPTVSPTPTSSPTPTVTPTPTPTVSPSPTPSPSQSESPTPTPTSTPTPTPSGSPSSSPEPKPAVSLPKSSAGSTTLGVTVARGVATVKVDKPIQLSVSGKRGVVVKVAITDPIGNSLALKNVKIGPSQRLTTAAFAPTKTGTYLVVVKIGTATKRLTLKVKR